MTEPETKRPTYVFDESRVPDVVFEVTSPGYWSFSNPYWLYNWIMTPVYLFNRVRWWLKRKKDGR